MSSIQVMLQNSDKFISHSLKNTFREREKKQIDKMKISNKMHAPKSNSKN